ncbi:MAG: thioredoxin family protein [Gemmatimonadetes bacterium]|nr:thioredoxin family protein [Gemmatimonadota bacterium]
MDRERFERAATFQQYLESVQKNRELWHDVYERVRLPDDLVDQARRVLGGWHLVALSEDWCGDAVNTLPVVARLADEAGWDLRVLGRDENPDMMEGHLTNGRSRSIPIVIVFDKDFNEVGWWGPRPSEIQAWVMGEGLAISSPERYKVIRRWYAKDRGRTTLSELLHIVAPAA